MAASISSDEQGRIEKARSLLKTLPQDTPRDVKRQIVEASLKARRVKALLSPIVSVTVALCTAIVLWRGSALIIAGVVKVAPSRR